MTNIVQSAGLGPSFAALVLGLACTSSAPPTVDAGAVDAMPPPPPLFSDHGMPAGTDLRFRSVGERLVYAPGGYSSAIQPGSRGPLDTVTGPNFGFALTSEDLYNWFLLRPPGDVVYETTFHADGLDCPNILAEAMTAGSIVLAMGGDPSTAGAACTLLWVRRLAGGPRYETVYRRGFTAATLLDSLRATETDRSFVVTALSATEGSYAYAASRVIPGPGDPMEAFETRIETSGPGELAAQAEALSAAGYVITAAVWSGANLTLVGTKPMGMNTTFTAKVNTDLESPQVRPALFTLLAEGYAPVSLTLTPEPLKMHLIGQKVRSP
jgi:hypothetical protein